MRTVLWIDDLRDPPSRPGERYIIARSVNEAKCLIEELCSFDIIDLDHDAGVYAVDGGDYINLLNWLEYRQRTQDGKIYPIRIHSFNPIGVVNMRAIIEHNGWEEVF